MGFQAPSKRKFSGKCSIITQIQQQTPGIIRQMFQKTAKTATNAGDYPANVPKNSQNSNKCRRLSGKCSKKQPKQQQMPGIIRQMFQKTAKTATNAGDSLANVPYQHLSSRERFDCAKLTMILVKIDDASSKMV